MLGGSRGEEEGDPGPGWEAGRLILQAVPSTSGLALASVFLFLTPSTPRLGLVRPSWFSGGDYSGPVVAYGWLLLTPKVAGVSGVLPAGPYSFLCLHQETHLAQHGSPPVSLPPSPPWHKWALSRYPPRGGI